MKITREADLPTEVVLNIECDEQDVDPYLDWAYRRLVNRVRIPGFRKGKAPRRILEQVVGREQLLSEALERAVMGRAWSGRQPGSGGTGGEGRATVAVYSAKHGYHQR